MDVAWRGDVIYRRDASASRSREVKKRTRLDYSTRTGRNVQLSAPKLGLQRYVALRDPEVTSYVGYWLIDVPDQNFFHLFSFPLLARQCPNACWAIPVTKNAFTCYLAARITVSNFVWMKPRISYTQELFSAKAVKYPLET